MGKGKVVIGSLKGNIERLGKDMVVNTLLSGNLQVVDLGVDVPPEEFVKAAVREGAQIIAISIPNEKTISNLKDLVEILEQENIRKKFKVVIGGSGVSEKVSQEYNLDAYASDARDCLKKVEALLS